MGVATPACQIGGQRTPPWAETEVRKARKRIGRSSIILLHLASVYKPSLRELLRKFVHKWSIMRVCALCPKRRGDDRVIIL